VQDLTDVVRVQSGRFALERGPVNLVELAQTCVELTGSMTESQSVRLETPSAPVVIDGDRNRLLQVMLNLIANAVQHGHSAQGTFVRVHTESERATLEVIDHGSRDCGFGARTGV
jgi:signal transduction histidine kinase